MAGKYLCNTSFLELLPDSIAGDEKIRAAAKALDREFSAVCDLIPTVAIWENLENTTGDLLDCLAWQMHVDYAEGYELARTDTERQNLIATSIDAHRHKGTRWALDRVAKILGLRLRIVEWWEEYPKGQPYTFRVEFTEVTRPVGPELYSELTRLVMELKNLRSYLAGITVFLAGQGNIRIASGMMTSQTITVYPWQSDGVEQGSYVPRVAAAMQTTQIITVYPSSLGHLRRYSRLPSFGAAMQTVQNLTVYPLEV